MRKTKTGGLLIEVRGDSATIEIVKKEIARLADEEVNVRTIHQKVLLEK